MMYGFILEKSIEKAVGFAKKGIDRLVLKNRILEFLEEQKKQNDSCTLAEEIDFSAYSDYICRDFIIASQNYIVGTDKERRKAYNSIISEAISRSNAQKSQARSRVTKMTSTALSIVKELSRKKLSEESQLLAAEMEDRIIAATEARSKNFLKELDQRLPKPEENSADHTSDLLCQGQMDEALLEEQKHRRKIDKAHDLFPHYGYDVKQIEGKDAWVSSPRTTEATSLFPPSFKGKCSFSIDGIPIPNGVNPFNYAYNHQKIIEMRILDAVHYLGDKKDPSQAEAEAFGKQIFEIKPPSLPENIPCKIMVDDETVIEYIRLSIDEVLDDGSLVVSNTKDPIVAIVLTVQISMGEKYYLNIRRIGRKVKNFLRFEELQYSLLKGRLFRIIRLDTEEVLGQGILEKEDTEELISRQKRIEFFRDLLYVEDQTQQTFILPDEISFQDCCTVSYLATLLREKRNYYPFNSAVLSFNFTDELGSSILRTNDKPKQVYFRGSIEFPIFGNNICIQTVRSISPVVVDNLLRIKDKVKVLDEGDSLKVKFIAPEDTQAYIVDTLPSSDFLDIKDNSLRVIDLPSDQSTHRPTT